MTETTKITEDIKNNFHSLTVNNQTIYFNRLEFENNIHFSETTILGGEIYRKITDTATEKIIIRGNIPKEKKILVKGIINALKGEICNITLDGTAYENFTLEFFSYKQNGENILDSFEIRLVTANE